MRFQTILLQAFVMYLIGVSCVEAADTAADASGMTKAKRRKVKKKETAAEEEGLSEVTEESVPTITTTTTTTTTAVTPPSSNTTEDKKPRGFLDQYYQQFDQRVQPSIAQSDLTSDNVHLTGESLDAIGGGGAAVGTQEVVFLPKEHRGNPDLLLPAKRTFLPSLSPSSPSSSYTGYGETDYSTKPLASKYFGLAATTSQDIQLGLTFTVPFLSIPLNSLANIFGGGGGSSGGLGSGSSTSGGLTDFFNFDTSKLLMLAVIAIGAIFILPQVIYWLTGVNLSAFNWGRSDDPGSYVTELADKVDRALRSYDVDLRQCVTSTACQQLKRKGRAMDSTKEEDNTITGMLGYGLVKTALKSQGVQKFLGEARAKELLGVAEGEDKNCEEVYAVDACPWDSKTSKKIVSKLIMDSDLDLSTLAEMAVQGAKAFAK